MVKQNESIEDLIPLREPTFLILLSLSASEKHGYAIMKDVEELSDGNVLLSTGTLYEALARLLDQRLIKRIEDPPGEQGEKEQNHPGRPRKTYRLSRRGRRVLEAEANRMQTLVITVRQRLGEESA